MAVVKIPADALSSEALAALIEEFVTRHGTDLTDAAAKAAQVRAQLQSGEVYIAFDEATESANIVHRDAKETARPDPHAPPRPPREARTSASVDGRHIVYDEPAPPDPTE